MKKLTVLMTNRVSIRIVPKEWPVIAHGCYFSQCTERECDFQALEKLEIDIRVRKHADERILVYGRYKLTSEDRDNIWRRSGYLYTADISSDTLMRAIITVGAEISDIDAPINAISDTVQDCISDFPPIDI